MKNIGSKFFWLVSFTCAILIVATAGSNEPLLSPIRLIFGMILVNHLIWVRERELAREEEVEVQAQQNYALERNRLHKECREAHDKLRKWIDKHEGNRDLDWADAPIKPFRKTLYPLIERFPVERRLPEVMVWMRFDKWFMREVSPLYILKRGGK